MLGWTLIDTHPAQGRTFHRPLDIYELGFLWDGLFNGTADNAQHFELHLSNGTRDARLFSGANVRKAWLSTKRRYPLVGATVRGADGTPLRFGVAEDSGNTGFASDPHFVVREHDLAVVRPQEIVFGSVACAGEVQARMMAILEGPRPLSEDLLLVQLHVIRETRPDRADVLHVMIVMAHCVTDVVANATFVRCLLDTLARGGEWEPVQDPLEERLAMVVASMDREPMDLRALSPAIRRWRRAAGMIIFQLKMAQRRGGHTLPCRITGSTPVAATSCRVSTSLTHAQTAAVIANCRVHDLTFGNAYLPLAQVAMTRVLYRRYLRGEISEEEWQHRKRQPHISGGPYNLRQYLDKLWFDEGGGGEFMLSIGFFFNKLPFMTLGHTTRVLSDGAPPFSDLLTFDRFLHRADLVKKQAKAFFTHPLFFEIAHATGLARAARTRLGTLQWMKHLEATGDSPDDEVLAAPDMVWAHGGSSLGSVDLISPNEYPLPSTHPLSPYSLVRHPVKAGYVLPSSPSISKQSDATTTRVVVQNTGSHLHARPAELYLGAASSRGQMSMYVFYDGKVFEDGVVKEWLDEVKAAVLWYLGGSQTVCRSRGVERTGAGRVGGGVAKL